MKQICGVVLLFLVCSACHQEQDNTNQQLEDVPANYWQRRMCTQPKYWGLDQCKGLTPRDTENADEPETL